MSNSHSLSDNSKEIIKAHLKLTDFKDVIDVDFRDLDIQSDKDRLLASKYINRVRGAIRLRKLLFYTKDEMEQRRKRIQSLQLP